MRISLLPAGGRYVHHNVDHQIVFLQTNLTPCTRRMLISQDSDRILSCELRLLHSRIHQVFECTKGASGILGNAEFHRLNILEQHQQQLQEQQRLL